VVRAVGDALAGRPRDYTAGSMSWSPLLLAIPMVIEMSMESLFALVDIWWVAQIPRASGSDADPVAVVGTTESMLSILYALAMGVSMAAAATVARRIGERDKDGAAVAAVQGISMAAAIAVVLGVVGALFSDELLGLMGARSETIAEHGGYAAVMFGGNATVMLLFVLNSVFRAAGDAAIAMRVLLVANGLNLILDPCLIFGWGPFPELGVTGAAVATNIGRGVGALYQLWQLTRPGRQFQVERRHCRIVREVVAPMISRAWTGAFQSLVMTTSWVGLVKVLSRYGETAVAGYTIGIRVVIFGLLPSCGIASAAAAMVGQSLGAKDPARAESAVWLAGRWNLVVLSSVGAIFFFGAPWIVGFFTDPADSVEVAVNATRCLRLIAVGFPFFAFGMCFSQAFNGAGDPWTPTWINLACFWIVEQPLARLLAGGVRLFPEGPVSAVPIVLGPSGVYWAISAAFALFAIVAGVLFRRGAWKRTVV
jgi:putative MATE family efflux protein